MAVLATTAKGNVKDLRVVRSKEVKDVIVPENMPLRTAAQWLLDKDKEEDKVVAVHHEFDCFPLDGAVSFRKALDDIYGFVKNINTPGMWADNPPTMIGVPVSDTEILQVPWGRVQIPNVHGYLETSMTVNPYPKFVLVGETKQRHLMEIEELVERLKYFLKTESIYKGKAIKLDLSWMRPDKSGRMQSFNPMGHAPKFSIDISKINEDDLIFPRDVQNDVELGLFTPIEQSEHCRRNQIPLKRGVLLAGEYGCGKTLTAYVTAKKAVNNGFTFIYLASALDLAAGFRFAQQYSPAVIFAEDVDQVAEATAPGQPRSDGTNAILNSFDGVDSKGQELITILTTNYLHRLDQAILRSGRCDTLVQVTRPDELAACRLVKLYGRGLINENADYNKIGKALKDHLPAEIRECVERAKLAAISRGTKTGELAPGGSIQGFVMEDDILAATHAIEAQHKLLEPKVASGGSVAERCAQIVGECIGQAIENKTSLAIKVLQQLGHSADDIYEESENLDNANNVEA